MSKGAQDDFEAFRKKQQEKKQAEQQAQDDAAKIDEAAQKMGWIDGLGPSGPKNPKVKGFVLGRYWPKKVDPSTLEKPKGYETHLEQHKPTPPEELEKRPRPKGIQKY